MWNVSKSIEYDAFTNSSPDINNAIINVAAKYYNGSLENANVYVYTEWMVSYFIWMFLHYVNIINT